MGVAVILAGLMFWTIESREAPASAAAIYEPARPDPIAPPMSPPTLAQVLDSPDPASVLVIGDSTGFADYQWVTRFANRIGLAYDRPVNVARWNEGTIAYDPPIAVAQGRGAPVTVWNASAPGESPRYSQTHLKAMTAPVRCCGS
ncbi:hypothetical protein LQ384_29040 [Rhodococcus rhodochrous]|uniref:SGNH/GDSL hydrolase family protein n=1 Tax=Rhodococcus rhodochrous TaxID=1829 RepID=A0AAW4XQ03_RHORH|nr:hypothetical protein [Rhodococcus rhodochrous]MCD2115116.1 hypothetical protein [Rhodococcus rhodochrous]